jgi:hypothetical protein
LARQFWRRGLLGVGGWAAAGPTSAAAASNQSSGVPMPGTDKATGRVIGVIVLLVLIAVALRGYLPGAARTPRERPPHGSADLVVLLVLVGLSAVIITFALITMPRGRRSTAGGAGYRSETRRGKRGRPKFRYVLIGLAVLLAWLLIVVLLSRLGGHHVLEHVPRQTSSTNAPPRTAPATPPPSIPPDWDRQTYGGYLGAITAMLLVLVVAGAVVDAVRRRRAAEPSLPAPRDWTPSVPAPGSATLVRAAELGLAEIEDSSREPREAIIACYVAMERGLEKAPGAVPQDSDTPSEVIARAVGSHALHADSATKLVALFAEARFSSHVMNEGHREVAERVLRLVLAELRSAA